MIQRKAIISMLIVEKLAKGNASLMMNYRVFVDIYLTLVNYNLI